jgi:hypothetical protein
MNAYRAKRVITRTFIGKFLLRLAVIFACGEALAALILYTTFHRPLGASYGESLGNLAELQKTLLMKSVYVHLFSFLLISIGVAIFSLRYSHRIVGPLVRLQRRSPKGSSLCLTLLPLCP